MHSNSRHCAPVYLRADAPLVFPDPRREFGFEGLVAIGGDLRPERLLLAYRMGIFPWFSEDSEILWWSPEPRAIIEMNAVHLSRSLARRLMKNTFSFSVNQAFAEVMLGCADREEGTWILPSMHAAYLKLHALGHAHSFEVWQDKRLVGGLYGVCVGRAFAAESMFHHATDASKAALVVAIRSLSRLGVTLFDVQYLTEHLSRMGATEISRDEYIFRLQGCQDRTLEVSELELTYQG